MASGRQVNDSHERVTYRAQLSTDVTVLSDKGRRTLR